MVFVAGPRSWKKKEYNYEGIGKFPINGTIDGYSVNEQIQQEADSMKVRQNEIQKEMEI